jgi:isoquinoline 1-oxidoreductase alpha subunit
MATSNSARASAMAAARPIPVEAPVTSAVRRVSVGVFTLLRPFSDGGALVRLEVRSGPVGERQCRRGLRLLASVSRSDCQKWEIWRIMYPVSPECLLSGAVTMPFTLTVNGRSRTVDVPADMPLLWVLRDVFDLKGTKYGCGVGQCGACTVHVNGQPTRSCAVLASSVAGRRITTIEGLSTDGTHPLQRAWQEIDVPQCGYCQAGQLMTAAALLANTPAPTDDDIDNAMGGNICRCGTYIRIRQAIHQAAAARRRRTSAGQRE